MTVLRALFQKPCKASSFLLIWLANFTNTVLTASSDGHQTLASLDSYKGLRACVQLCFGYGNAGCTGDSIADAVNCPYGCFDLALDSCYCRADLQTDAEKFLTSCIKTRCTAGGDTSIDIASAVSIYDGYCTGQGYTALREPQSTIATLTSGTEGQTAAQTSLTTITPFSTAVSTSEQQSTSSVVVETTVFTDVTQTVMPTDASSLSSARRTTTSELLLAVHGVVAILAAQLLY